MKLHTINTGLFKLDGGAMFGVVPKTIWNKLNPADENNMCTWAMRCLLVEEGDRLVLIDTGIGTKQDAKFLSYYYLHGDDSLKKSIQQAGYSMDEVTDVVLTHLHFDHCGGAVEYSFDKSKAFPAFKNATYWSNKRHWEWATNPNPREKASFLQENIQPIQASGQLKFVDEGETPFSFMKFLMVDGHTDHQMLPIIHYMEKTLVYVADLIPSIGHLPVAYVMGYDTRPLLAMDEKSKFLKEAVANNYYLFFEHDPLNEVCSLVQTEKGVRSKDVGTLASFFV